MPSKKEIKKVIQDNLSHPPDVIKCHITTGVCLAFLVALIFILYLFFTSIKNDPVLYTQMSLGNEKEKYN